MLKVSIHFFCLLALSRGGLLSSCKEYTKIVKIQDGDEKACRKLNQTLVICPSLEKALHIPSLNNTCIQLKQGFNYIESIISWHNVYRFALVGSEISPREFNVSCTVNIACKLSFNSSTDITFSGFFFRQNQATDFKTLESGPALFTFNLSCQILFQNVMVTYLHGHNIISLANCDSVKISQATFQNNVQGSVISIVYQDKQADNTEIVIANSNFEGNDKVVEHDDVPPTNAMDPTGKGAAVYASFLGNSSGNGISLISNTFTSNKACYGSAFYSYFSHDSRQNSIVMQNNLFDQNNAIVSGGAVYIANFASHRNSNSIHIADSSFTNNSVSPNQGGGAMFCYNCWLVLEGSITFMNNRGTAIVLGACQMEVYGQLLLFKNTGKYGGAIFLYKCSSMIMKPLSNTKFIENFAEISGGAMYVFHQFSKDSTVCFIHPNSTTSLTDSSILFKQNKAGFFGDHIFSSTLKLCPNLKFNNDPREGITFRPFRPTSVNTAPFNLTIKASEWDLHPPGFYFTPKVYIYDEKNHTSESTLQVQFNSTDSNVSEAFKNTFVVSKTNMITVSLHGQQYTTYEASFYINSDLGILTREIALTLGVCPSHYHLRDGICHCKTVDSSTKCYTRLYVLPNLWLHKDKSYKCPKGYCNINCTMRVRQYCLYEPKKVCSTYRNQTSRLCSECEQGLSVTLGNSQCMDCSSKDLNIVWFSIVVVVSIFLLCCLFAFLNYHNFAAYYIPIIVFYQLVPSLLINRIGEFNSLVFTMFNSDGDFTEGFCVMNNMDNLSRLWVRFATGLLWLVLYAILFLISKSRVNLMMAVLRSWPLVFMIYYIDIVKFTLQTLHGVYIDGSTYVYHFAKEEYCGQRHLPMFLCALITFLLTVVCLLLIWREMRRRNPILMGYFEENTMSSIVSSERIKWFFLFYTAFLTTFLAFGELYVKSDKTTCLLLVSMVFVGIFTFKKPYLELSYNVIETFIYLDMLMIGAIGTVGDDDDNDSDQTGSTIVEILLAAPFCCLVVAIIYTITLHMISWRRRMQSVSIRRTSSNFPARAFYSDEPK